MAFTPPTPMFIKDALKNNPPSNGYPNNVTNTQTLKTRGTGAATKGTHSSTKMG